MLKILWKRGEIAPEEQFLLLFTIISYLILDFYVTTRIRFSLRDKRLFEITEVEITRVECTCIYQINRLSQKGSFDSVLCLVNISSSQTGICLCNVWMMDSDFTLHHFHQFLAHLSHRLRVSYCHWPMFVVRRPSCVVNNCFKQHLL